MSKTVLFLGAAHAQMPPIRYARDRGYRVITCDYRPDNPGHALADRSYDVSTTDLEGVLQVAKENHVDGIVAYASDPAAPTQAYIAEKLGLAGNPYDSVRTLTDKDRFRAFLQENGFNAPKAKSFIGTEEASTWCETLTFPIFVKPVDSSGSKGVTRIKSIEQLGAAFDLAKKYSLSGRVILEEEIVRDGPQVAGDGFVVDGKLAFRCWADENFDPDCNGLVPIGESFPCTQPDHRLDHAHAETQRILDLLGIERGALNFDFVFDRDDRLHFLEIGPRNGGCLIPDTIKYATGVDLIAATVESALGADCQEIRMAPAKGFWSSYMIHSLRDGLLKGVWTSPEIEPHIVEQELWKRHGEPVTSFLGANATVGASILRFDTLEQMKATMRSMNKHVHVKVQQEPLRN